jgi:putative transposase
LLPSSVADKWEEEVIKSGKVKQRTIKVKIYPSREQKAALNEIFSVYNYVYNKTNEMIKNKKFSYLNWMDLRDKLVTCDTKKGDPEYIKNTELKAILKKQLDIIYDMEEKEDIPIDEFPAFIKREIANALDANIREANKDIDSVENENIKDFEKKIHKDIRADAVKVCCEMYKSANTNLKNGNIKWFDIGYKKKSSPSKCFGGINVKMVKFTNQNIQLMPGKLGKNLCDFKISKKSYTKYAKKNISGECRVFYQKGNYFIGLNFLTEQTNTIKTDKVCGIDPGLRSFCTIYDKESVLEINQNRSYLKALNAKIKILKQRRARPRNEKDILRKRRRKRHFNKIEKKKIDYTNSIHWATISFLLNTYDAILLGDIKSHDIVKKGFNASNNQEFNDLKFLVFKQRLVYKAGLANKFIKLVNEFNTTKCCSNCGNLNHFVGASEIYKCNNCNLVCGRDSNAAKNILLKGILCK